jgi:HK97 family phage prohead protease
MEHKSFSLGEFKALGDGEDPGTFEAVVAVFNNVDHGGDRIRPGAFKRSIAEWAQKGRSVPVLWSHDAETVPIGVIKRSWETTEGLRVKARLFIEDHPQARAVYAAMKGGALHEFSFGYGVPAGGAKKTFERGKQIRDLIDLDWAEASPVFRGMNPSTRLVGVKSAAETDIKSQRADLDRKIAEMTEQRDALTEAVENLAEVADGDFREPALTPEAPPAEPGAEHNDKPEPNAPEAEEAAARIRALQATQPAHVVADVADLETPS